MSLPDTYKPRLAIAGALAVALFLVGMALRHDTLMLLVKGIPATVMGIWVWRDGADRRIAVGLIFGALGDIFLNIQGAFLAGMLAFAIGHGLYVLAFWRWHRAAEWDLALPIAVYLGVALSFMLPGTGELSVPVVLYMCIIGAMIWRAAALASPAQHWTLRWVALIGALLFAFSDTLIGINKFVTPLSGVSYVIIMTYWGGQLFIAASAIARKHHSV